jgi:DNA-binding transcriptional regulator YhcF (GntR family)
MTHAHRRALKRIAGVEAQIRDHIRGLILSGDLANGEKLPPTEQLAGLFSAGSQTVQRALTPLVKEGLLLRRPKHGTFVRQREERLTCVGLYLREDFMARHSSNFQLALQAEIKKELHRLGIRVAVWVDPRPPEEQAAPWPELCKAIRYRELQGLIVPVVDKQLSWLTKLQVPSAVMVSSTLSSGVDTDLGQMAELSLRSLVAQGCRSVGVVTPLFPSLGVEPDGSKNSILDFFDCFTELAGELGVTIKNEWMRVPGSRADPRSLQSHEQFGYTEFLALWDQPDRPDGLIVYPDATGRGVITGLLMKQVRVPDDLKLVLHKNETDTLLCPLPVTLAVLSEREVALALIEQVQRQFRGECCEPIKIAFTLLPTGGETQPQIQAGVRV